MLKSMKTKDTNKLIKEEMERIKSLPADQRLRLKNLKQNIIYHQNN